MTASPSSKLLRWLAVLLVTAGLFWLAGRIFPWYAASPSEVEKARANIQRGDKVVASFVDAALDRTRATVRYEGDYMVIPYPNGDVPKEIGVCTDEVIRSYRSIGVDLQELVHRDMRGDFSAYPRLWGLSKPDPNIDHRRVPNLQVFFERQGAELPITEDPKDYLPGDIITNTTWGGSPHVAIVVPSPEAGGTPWIMHNRGFGPKMENQLFRWQITGHYRWRAKQAELP
jgi:uncharacterized protein